MKSVPKFRYCLPGDGDPRWATG